VTSAADSLARDPIHMQRRIAAPPELVFAYFTDPARFTDWLGIAAELDPRPGGLFRVEMDSGDVACGEFVEVDAPHRVVFTWGWEGEPRLLPGTTMVEIELTAEDGGTLLQLRHTGLRTDRAFEIHTGGWTESLDRLAAAV
jgi:uncharacterized protein YndB with AHSA1/START domain